MVKSWGRFSTDRRVGSIALGLHFRNDFDCCHLLKSIIVHERDTSLGNRWGFSSGLDVDPTVYLIFYAKSLLNGLMYEIVVAKYCLH